MYQNGRTQQKRLDKMKLETQLNFFVPRIYAAIACALWKRGWEAEEIQDVFRESQEIWADSTENKWDILKNVQEVTGIEVAYFKDKGRIV